VRTVPLICAALVLLGCADVEYGVAVDGERLPVIDMHLHPGEWSNTPPDTQEFLAGRFPFPLQLTPARLAGQVLSVDGLKEELDGAGIGTGVLFAVYAPRTVGISANEDVIADVKQAPDRFYGLASLRVERWNQDEASELQRLRDALGQAGMVGVKLAHAHQHFRMDDPRYFSIYALAGELGKPVYLHTGTSPFPGTAQDPPYTDPAYLEPAIVAHPQTIFILGHVGYDFKNQQLGAFATCLALAGRHANVYLEPSALGSRSSDPSGANLKEVMRRIREASLVDRAIYGSDGPQSPGFVDDYLGRTVAAMREAGYSRDELAAVLAGNFVRVFAVAEPAR
jgi:predicted TIM-barrel fold metal-dependent hydrolase